MKRSKSDGEHCLRCGAAIIRVAVGGEIIVREGRVMPRGSPCRDGLRCSAESPRSKR